MVVRDVMDQTPQVSEEEIKRKFKWLILFRILFSTLLLGSTIILQFGGSQLPLNSGLIILYGLIAAIFLLSLLYAVGLYRLKRLILVAYAQIIIDTFVVTVILFVTGNYSSIFWTWYYCNLFV